jgi:hypothetical protein
MSPGIEEEERCGGPPTSPPSRLMKPPPSAREEERPVAVRPSHLLHTRGRRSGVVVAGASHLLARGRRSGVTQGRSEPPIAVSGVLLHELRMLANHD